MRYLLFFLTPLVYSMDGDPFRAYEVVLIGILFSILFLRARMKKIGLFEIVALSAYSFFLILQQFFIPSGNLFFGIKFMIATIMAFFPFWVLRSSHWHRTDILTPVARAIDVLCIISVLNFFSSFAFGIGERSIGGFLGYRAFGFMGDSFTPVLIFLFLYYFLEKRWVFFTLSLACLLMTGGKTGIIMAGGTVAVYFLFVSNSAITRFLFLVATLILFVLPVGIEDSIQNVRNFQFSLNNRLLSFQVGWEYFRENPVFGIGINQGLGSVGNDVQTLARSLGLVEYFPVNQIHNAFLRALAETGVIGFGFLALLAVYWVREGISAVLCARELPQCRERNFLAAAGIWTICFVLGYQTTGWFLHGHPQLAWLLMLSTYASIITKRVASNKQQNVMVPVQPANTLGLVLPA